jgi:hypothetical protein
LPQIAQPALVAPAALAAKAEHIGSFARAATLQLSVEDFTQLNI